MIVRILTAQVAPGRLGDWWNYSKTTGFPVMRRQPGMRAIYRLGSREDEARFAYLTVWDSIEDLDRFKASEDMAFVLREGRGLTVAPSSETLFEHLPDDEDVALGLSTSAPES